MFERRNKTYAHPLIGILSDKMAAPIIAPQKEICSIILIFINESNTKCIKLYYRAGRDK